MPVRKKPKVVKENSERWLLTYSDLITLLMIFFIILYAMSSTNARKFQDLTGALKQAFNNGAFQLIQVGGTISSKTHNL
jgi:chemotaxis protein MotB